MTSYKNLAGFEGADLSPEERESLRNSITSVLNTEIVRELLREDGIEPTDELIARLLQISPNPWDAGILYKVLERTGKL